MFSTSLARLAVFFVALAIPATAAMLAAVAHSVRVPRELDPYD